MTRVFVDTGSRLPVPGSRFPVPGSRFPTGFYGQLDADERTEPGSEGGFMEARRAGDAVAIQQRHRRIAEQGRAIDQRLGHRRRAQETKG